MVKEGYKQTEAGLIPDDWDTITFRECFDVLPNNTLSRAELNYNGGKIKNIHYGDVLIKFPEILDCERETLPFVNPECVSKLSTAVLQDGDIIIADTAEDNTVGKATEIIGIGEQRIVSGLHTIPCRPKQKDRFTPKWLGYFVNHHVYHDQLLPLVTGIKVSSISKGAIADTVIAIPEKVEQERVVEVFSDMDNLIFSLEKLISKKKDIKNGLVNDLLSGQKRLGGFTEDWIEIKLKEMFSEFIVPMRDKPKSLNGPIPWCRIEDFDGKYLSKSKSDQGVSLETVEEMNLRVFPVGTLLVSCSANLGKCAIVASELVTNQTFIGMIPNAKADVDFFYYRMCFEEKALNTMATGTTITYLSREQFEEYEMKIPATKEEQIAISTLLSDVDAEIEALQLKLQKYNQMKSGMMDDLLTGKVRLV